MAHYVTLGVLAHFVVQGPGRDERIDQRCLVGELAEVRVGRGSGGTPVAVSGTAGDSEVTGWSLSVVATALDTAVLASSRLAVATPTGVVAGGDPQPAVATATSASSAPTFMTSWTHTGCARFPIGSARSQNARSGPSTQARSRAQNSGYSG